MPAYVSTYATQVVAYIYTHTHAYTRNNTHKHTYTDTCKHTYNIYMMYTYTVHACKHAYVYRSHLRMHRTYVHNLHRYIHIHTYNMYLYIHTYTHAHPCLHDAYMCKLVTGFFELPPSDSTLVFHSMRWPQLGHVT